MQEYKIYIELEEYDEETDTYDTVIGECVLVTKNLDNAKDLLKNIIFYAKSISRPTNKE